MHHRHLNEIVLQSSDQEQCIQHQYVAAVLRIGRIANQDEADAEASRRQQRLNDHGAAQQAHEESLTMAIDQMCPEAIHTKSD
jgi:hypothetical protein